MDLHALIAWYDHCVYDRIYFCERCLSMRKCAPCDPTLGYINDGTLENSSESMSSVDSTQMATLLTNSNQQYTNQPHVDESCARCDKITHTSTHTLATTSTQNPSRACSAYSACNTLNTSSNITHTPKTPNVTITNSMYESIIDKSPDAIVTANINSVIIYNNASTEKMFGYSTGTLIGQKINILMPSPHNELHDEYVKLFYKKDPTDRRSYACPKRFLAIKKSGETFPIQITMFESSASDQLISAIIKDLSNIDNMEKVMIQDLEEKNMFATNISHELRTPLNSIINMNYLLGKDLESLKDIIDEDKYADIKDSNDIIKRNCTILHTQINDILDYAKLDSKQVVIRKNPFSLAECIDICKDIHGAAAVEKGLELVTSIDPEIHDELIGDHERITQVVMNLLSNAIKFTDRGKVALRIASSTHDLKQNKLKPNELLLYITVSDSGIGIPPEDADKLFRSFTQLRNSTNRKCNGTGLGLSICKKICNLMGGDIWLESSKPGVGSTFKCAVMVEVAKTTIGIMNLNDCDTFNTTTTDSKRILIVDDDENNIMTFSQYAIEWKMIPTTATSGRSALVFVKGNMQFDIALVDFKMRHMNGQELATRMKKLGIKYPLVALTSNDSLDNSVFDAVLVKPIKKTKLFRIINKLLTRQQSSQSTQSDDHQPLPHHDIPTQYQTHQYQHNGPPLLISGNNNIAADHLGLSLTNSNSSSTATIYADALSDNESETKCASGSSNDDECNKQPRILIAEDNPDHQKVISRLLRSIGYTNYTITGDGREALEQMRHSKYKLALIDINMPTMGGLECVRKVRETIPKQDQPILIALTAVATYGEKEFYITEGKFDDYISKPIYVHVLEQMLAKYLNA